jgi:hypothetical protein
LRLRLPDWQDSKYFREELFMLCKYFTSGKHDKTQTVKITPHPRKNEKPQKVLGGSLQEILKHSCQLR